MSCPNLLKTVYQANTINTQLNTAFSDFVNSPKGVKLKDSNIYIYQKYLTGTVVTLEVKHKCVSLLQNT
jgi:hypothetical protein